MIDQLGFKGKQVIVTGCSSGMGQATATLLVDLGAEVHGLDYQQCNLGLTSFALVDLRDPASIDRAANGFSGKIDALFNCAGVAPPYSAIDIMKVNSIGTRYLTERILPHMTAGSTIGSIASTAGMGWSRRIPVHKELLKIENYAASVQWAQDNFENVGEIYSFSKESIIVWTMISAQHLIKRGIRINCVLPGLTQTSMLDNQIAVTTSPTVLEGIIQPIGRPARPEEQAFPLVMLSSSAASYVNGAALNVDGGRLAKLATE